MDRDWIDEATFWLVYFAGALTAGYHSYIVFRLSDPWFIALAGAIALDGLTAYALRAIKNWYGRQRLAGFLGLAVFGVVSSLAQQIARRHGLGEPLPAWLAWVSLTLFPVSSVLSVLVLGVIRSLKEGDAKPENPMESLRKMMGEIGGKIGGLVERVETMEMPRLASGGGGELDDFTKSELPKLTTEFASEVPAVKRGPGRPRKTDPKL